jgi:hypothetical protein
VTNVPGMALPQTTYFCIRNGDLTREDIDMIANREKVYIPPDHNSQQRVGTFRDVHHYDGQGVELKLDPVLNKEELKYAFNCLIRLLRIPAAGSMVHIIYRRSGKQGVDGINGILTDALLYNIICRPITVDLFYLLEEQLSDNYNLGQCLQGVSWRLRQIYQAQTEF